MRSTRIILPILLFLLISCDFRSDYPALWTIGKNKKEFQKVYDNYSKPEDSLKLKAAKFLVENMRDHYYFVLKNDEKVDDFFESISNKITIPQDTTSSYVYSLLRQNMMDELISKGLEDGSLAQPKYEMKTDMKNISAEFLIENIEYAFKAWEFPWSRDYSFDDFCKYILPYRYSTEPPSSWRKEIFEEYKWIVDSLPNATSAEAAALINKKFAEAGFEGSDVLEKTRIRLKITNQLDVKAFTDCFDQTGLGVSALRALGIPSAVAKIPRWGNRNNGHEMTGIMNLQGGWNIFNFTGGRGPNELHRTVAPKIFMKHFDEMDNFEPVLIDASGELMKTVDLEVEIYANEYDEVYLCVFDNLSWRPLFKGENLKTKAIFADVGYNESMFIAAKKTKNKLKAVSYPFLPDSIGKITYFKPNLEKQTTTSFERKYPTSGSRNARLVDLKGGKFTIANSKDFENKNLLYEIDSTIKYRNNIVKVPEQTGKYVRYEFPKHDDSNYMEGPAEISFYTTNNGKLEKVTGRYYGSPQISQEHIEIMTDNDELNYVRIGFYNEYIPITTGLYILRKVEETVWVGMELDSETKITHIGICPRNDKNSVYPGMNYELFYWGYAWISLGEKQATSHSISYDGIPENALLWLRNLDEGKEERIFILNEGKQIWY